ncbi:MAG: tyrosinase family protein [Scytonema sp. PMC 1069.18]|nr:tyrosinase family protein [Scytonema sp. PMC 1069.18]MEC4880301.1 tyrosinase family protein [Scytonema sp. PMC 1070.18]
MNILRRTIKTGIIASIVAALIVFGSPALSYNTEHRIYEGTSTQVLNSNSLHKADFAGSSGQSKHLISRRNWTNIGTIRKNVVDLTPEEKSAFVQAIQTLKQTFPEGSHVSIYDQFVAIHVASMGLMYEGAQGPAAGHDGAHESALFLPWHREFVYRFEKALQAVNPSVTIPYWDWTDSKALDIIFQDDFMGPNGQGVSLVIPNLGDVQGGPVVSGPFTAASGWVLNSSLHINDSGETLGDVLLRFMRVPPTNNYPVPKEDEQQLFTINDYETFRQALEGFIKLDNSTQQPTPGVYQHNYFHSFVGGATFDPAVGRPEALGTMAALASSINDPVFWLIHSNVDRLWAEWQKDGHKGSDYYPASGGHYGENLKDRMWPWDGGESTPANWGPGDLLSLLPYISSDDIVTPADTLNYRKYGYSYDTASRTKKGKWFSS